MDTGQIARIFTAVTHDSRVYETLERYAIRKLKFNETSSEIEIAGEIYSLTLHQIRAPVMWAVEDFLKRGGQAQAAAYREKAETLEKALDALTDEEFHHFPSLIAMTASRKPMGGTGRSQAEQALGDFQAMAKYWRGLADTHKQAEVNNTFFYCLGRRFKKESDLPLLSAREAHSLFVVIVDAIRNESPALLDGMKTDYSPDESSSEIRRLMKSGYNAAR